MFATDKELCVIEGKTEGKKPLLASRRHDRLDGELAEEWHYQLGLGNNMWWNWLWDKNYFQG